MPVVDRLRADALSNVFAVGVTISKSVPSYSTVTGCPLRISLADRVVLAPAECFLIVLAPKPEMFRVAEPVLEKFARKL